MFSAYFVLIVQIAEGGYSFVYLAHEVPNVADDEDARSRQYAIKKVPLPSSSSGHY